MGAGEKKVYRIAQRSHGAILLHVLIATTVVGLILFAWWKENSLSYDIIVLREQQYKNRYMADLLLSYGVELLKMRGRKKAFTVDCRHITRLLGDEYRATITFSEGVLYATLYKKTQKLCGVSCTLG